MSFYVWQYPIPVLIAFCIIMWLALGIEDLEEERRKKDEASKRWNGGD